VADNSPIARHPTATGNLESFTRLNECLGDFPPMHGLLRFHFLLTIKWWTYNLLTIKRSHPWAREMSCKAL
jgi:hypothetical protein